MGPKTTKRKNPYVKAIEAYYLIQLARQFGTSILRNAMALAEAIQIEDGNAGL